MNAQKSFYSKLYERQQTNQNSDEAKRSLENPSISKLPEELRASCEGNITIDECEKILGSFQTGKTSGNDGIPIEFYKTFWPLIGVFMIDSVRRMITRRCLHRKSKPLSLLLIRKGKAGIFIKASTGGCP